MYPSFGIHVPSKAIPTSMLNNVLLSGLQKNSFPWLCHDSCRVSNEHSISFKSMYSIAVKVEEDAEDVFTEGRKQGEASKMPHSLFVGVPSSNYNIAGEVDGTQSCQHPVILVEAAPIQVICNPFATCYTDHSL
jgi:hypothetical protein